MITITITGETPAAIGQQASSIGSLLSAAKAAANAGTGSTPGAAKPAPAKPAPGVAAAAKPAPAAAAKPAPAAAAAATEGEITLNSLRELGRQCIKAQKQAEMKAALTELGADSITTLDPSRYAECDTALRAVIEPAAAPANDGL